MKPVRKALIPAAGLGTRFLPATKSVPKELLPIVDEPILLYIVEEIIAAGIEDIVFIAGRGKTAIDDFFDVSYELEDKLAKQGKLHYLKKLFELRDKANFIAIRQGEALGLGHAVFCGQPVIGDDPFAVLLGDEFMVGSPGVTQELVSGYNETGHSTVAVMNVPKADVVKYGIVGATELSPGRYKVHKVVEKPSVEAAPSTLALPGRYVFEGKIFQYLKDGKPGVNGEIQLTDSMQKLADESALFARAFQAKRYDAGDKLGFLQATVERALVHPEVGAAFKEYLKDLTAKLPR